MSLISKTAERQNCPSGRRGHRYWTSQNKCRLEIGWEEGQWEVSFVDTESDMRGWVNSYGSDILLFDCEWSKADGVGVIQFATLPSSRQVLIVDCCRVDLNTVKNIFDNHVMVGWATPGDKKHLGLDSASHVIDLQELTKQSEGCEKMSTVDKSLIRNYQPLNRHGQPHDGAWGLDDMAMCFLGHTVKVPLEKHPKWSEPTWMLYDRDIHYAANDVIGLAYIYDKLKYIYTKTDLVSLERAFFRTMQKQPESQ